MAQADSPFIRNIVRFCRQLRGLGFAVGPDRVALLIRALELTNLRRRQDAYSACESVLLSRISDREIFRSAFDSFWQEAQPVAVPAALAEPGGDNLAIKEEMDLAVAEGVEGEAQAEESGEVETLAAYSSFEILRQRDIADLSEAELVEILTNLRRFRYRQEMKRSRRLYPRGIGRFDLRLSVRANLRHGGEWVHWMRQGYRLRNRPLVVLADVSGSMERYSRVLILFLLWLLAGAETEVELFLFGTQLTRIDRATKSSLRKGDLSLLARAVPDWGGGTRIGPALRQFNQAWAHRLASHGANAILISDGWDRGSPDLLRRELARLSRTVTRLIWLNPLLGSDDYQPLTRGMRTALPFIDEFLPAHNLASLEDLLQHLQPSARTGSSVIAARRLPSRISKGWPA